MAMSKNCEPYSIYSQRFERGEMGPSFRKDSLIQGSIKEYVAMQCFRTAVPLAVSCALCSTGWSSVCFPSKAGRGLPPLPPTHSYSISSPCADKGQGVRALVKGRPCLILTHPLVSRGLCFSSSPSASCPLSVRSGHIIPGPVALGRVHPVSAFLLPTRSQTAVCPRRLLLPLGHSLSDPSRPLGPGLSEHRSHVGDQTVHPLSVLGSWALSVAASEWPRAR